MTSRVFRKYINITLVGYGLVLIPWMIITNFSGHEVAENFSLEEIRTLTEKYRYTPLANRSLVKICLENLAGREGGRYQIVFLGDSRMRQIYKALVRLVANGSEPQDYASETEKEHRTLSFQHGHLAIDFHWAPGPEDIIDAYKSNLSHESRSVIVMGCGIHSMLDRDAAEELSTRKKLQIYSKHIKTIRALSTGFASAAAQFWLLQPRVQPSLFGIHLKRNGQNIGNSMIELFNSLAVKEFKSNDGHVVLWMKLAEIANTTSDGLHLDVGSLKASNQMILNVLCQKDWSKVEPIYLKWLINRLISWPLH